jgi:hypothetical protein
MEKGPLVLDEELRKKEEGDQFLEEQRKSVKHESSPPKKESKSQCQLPETTYEVLSEIFKKILFTDQSKRGGGAVNQQKKSHSLFFLSKLNENKIYHLIPKD